MTRFAMIGDLHFSSFAAATAEQRARRDAFYRSVLQEFFAYPADLHIAVGDVTHEGNSEEWNDFMSMANDIAGSQGRTFCLVLGNHDTLAQSKQQVLEQTGQQRFHVREYAACRMLMLDTTLETSPHNWSGLVDEEQLSWLDSLGGIEKKLSLVIGHHPFPDTTVFSEEPMMRVTNADEVLSRIAAIADTVVYFNGHNHVHNIVQGSGDTSGWTFVQSASALCAPSFRTVEVTNESVQVRTVVLTDPAIQSHAQAIREGLTGYAHKPEALGQNADHAIVIPRGVQ